MSEVQIGSVEQTPISWQPANTLCSICNQEQFNGFQGEKFVGVCCPNSHWNVPGTPKVVEQPVIQPQPQAQITDPLPPNTITEWSNRLSEEQENTFNRYQDSISQLTNNMKNDHLRREEFRQAIATMTCPFTVGMIIETGTGQAPKDRKVITKISGGDTFAGEFWRAWCRVLKKDGKLGDKPYRIHPSSKGYRIKGMYNGVEGLPVENIEEDMVI